MAASEDTYFTLETEFYGTYGVDPSYPTFAAALEDAHTLMHPWLIKRVNGDRVVCIAQSKSYGVWQ